MPILSSVAFATAKAYGFGSPDLFAGAALSLAFDETTTLDSRITFTRATNGTYFDSAGTLQTASSGVARFDHRLESGVWVNKGLLIEEQRTNLALRSNDFTNATWVKTNITASLNQTGPDGVSNSASSITASSSNATVLQTITSASAQRAASCLVKRITGSGTIQMTMDNGTTWTAVTVTSDWTVVSIPSQTVTNPVVGFRIVTSSDAIAVFGFQLENGAFPTSTITTTSASVTRNADVASMTSTNFSSWYNATEGTVFWQGDMIGLGKTVFGASAARGWAITDGGFNERMFQNLEDQASAGATLTTGSYVVVDGSVTQASMFSPSTPNNAAANTTYKYASVYKANDFALSLNGAAPTVDTSGTLPAVNRLELGHEQAAQILVMCGHIAKFYYWNTRKPDSFLQSITG